MTIETANTCQANEGQIPASDLTQQIVELNCGRADFYRMLSQLYFKELTQEEIDHLASLDFEGMAGEDAQIAEGYNDLAHYLRRVNTGTRQELAVDYAHTILAAGNYETYAATPFESVFTSELGLLMQEARDEVYKAYCKYHIQPSDDLHTPEDHVSFEFEFLASLLEHINDALLAGKTEQAAEIARDVEAFHEQHQLNWIDDLCDAVLDVAETRFYRGVAKITRGFVHMETDVIADELDVLSELADMQAAA